MIEEYKRDGYVVLRDAVDWYIPLKALFHDAGNSLPMAFINGGVDLMRRKASEMAKRPTVYDAFRSLRIKMAVEELGIQAPIFTTAPAIHVNGIDPNWNGVEAHQDWPAIQTGLNSIVVWMPTWDVQLDNFPLEMAPGSHLQGLLPSKAGDHYSSVDASGMEFVPVPMRQGDVLLFSVFTVHRTRTPGRGFRCAFSHRYEDALDPWYVKHGYAAQSRVIARDIKFAPTTEEVKGVFG